jgi:hypothetical protein
MPIRKSSVSGGSTPSGTTEDRPANPSVGDTFFNGTLGVQEIYTPSGWLPANGANDFNVVLTGENTSVTLDKEYLAGSYTISSAFSDGSLDIYLLNSEDSFSAYANGLSIEPSIAFSKIIVLGGQSGDLITFTYKTTYTTASTTSETGSAAFINSVSPASATNIDDTITISGGNFDIDVEVYFIGSDNVERQAKSVIVSNSSVLIATRPDDFPTNLGSYGLKVVNPGIPIPSGSLNHILNNAVSAGTSPSWITSQLPEVGKDIPYSTSLNASDEELTDVTYSVVSGSLPSGISLNSQTGIISGTYSLAEEFSNSITIRATDTGGNYSERDFTIFYDIPVLVTAPTDAMPNGTPYSSSIVVSDGSSVTHSVFSGTLPSGISLNSETGLISGTPTISSDTTVTLRSTDAAGNYIDTSITFIPNPILGTSNLWGYYDASSSSNYILSSGRVSQWTDLSGNNRHLTQATTARRPEVKVSEKNGLDVIYFDGAQRGLVSQAETLTNPVTIFFVVKMYSLASYSSIFDGINNNEANITGNSNNTISIYTQGFIGGLSPVSTATWYYVTFKLDGANSGNQLNSNAMIDFSDGSVNLGGLRIGEGDNGSENAHMDIGEFAIFNRALSTSEIASITSYLSAKWNI